MSPTRSTSAFLALASIATPCLAQVVTTQFVLIPMEEKVGPQTLATVVEPPRKVSFKAVDCAVTVNLGGVAEMINPDPSKNYVGTAYAGELEMARGHRVSGFVMNRPMPVGTHISHFQVLEDGQTCSELINGRPYVFRKYVAIISRQ